jgi:hypothetical protein
MLYFLLTRVTRIFQKSVFTEIAPIDVREAPRSSLLLRARKRCRAALGNATAGVKNRHPISVPASGLFFTGTGATSACSAADARPAG